MGLLKYGHEKAIDRYDFDKQVDLSSPWLWKRNGLKSQYGSSDLVPLNSADMDFMACDEVIDAIKEYITTGVFGYLRKDKDYYDSIIDWYRENHGLSVKRSAIVQTHGALPLVSACINAFTRESGTVVVQAPSYWNLYRCVTGSGRTLVYSNLRLSGGKYEMDFDDLDTKLMTADMLIVCSPSNPTGRVWTMEELKALCELCIKHNILLLSDEIHCDFVYGGHKHIPILTVMPEIDSHAIQIVSTSKAFNLASISTATAFIRSKPLMKKLKDFAYATSSKADNALSAVAAKAAYRYGYEWLRQCNDYVYGNYVYIKEFLAENVPEIIPAELEGTFLVWLDCRELVAMGVDIEMLFEKSARIAGDAGKKFGKRFSEFYRLNIATRRGNIEEAMDRLLMGYNLAKMSLFKKNG